LAMAVGSAVLREMQEKKLVEHCQRMGHLITDKLETIARDREISNVRGKGLLLAFDLVSTPAADLVERCLKDGLIINAPSPSSFRLIPPLIVTEEDIDRCVAILLKNLR